ncbi:hypothetical protein D3C85_1734010 [compost metagenome]
MMRSMNVSPFPAKAIEPVVKKKLMNRMIVFIFPELNWFPVRPVHQGYVTATDDF